MTAMSPSQAKPQDVQWHVERMNAIVLDLWRANNLDLHMCDGTVRTGQSGVLRDIRNSWREIRHALQARGEQP